MAGTTLKPEDGEMDGELESGGWGLFKNPLVWYDVHNLIQWLTLILAYQPLPCFWQLGVPSDKEQRRQPRICQQR